MPLDLGQQRRGMDMSPSAVRVAGVEAHLEQLGHVVTDAPASAWASSAQWPGSAASTTSAKPSPSPAP
jgi:hypothetical protein